MSEPLWANGLTFEEWLKREWFYISTIANVAKQVASNYIWLDLNEAKPVLMLDFDILCRALPNFAAETIAAGGLSEPQQSVLDALTGPDYLRSVLSSLELVSLPPGTLAEAAYRTKLLSGQTSDEVARFFKKLEEAQRSSNPARVICPGISLGDKIAEAVWQELYSIAGKLDDLTTLKALREASIPYTELSTNDPVPETMLTFRVVRDVLNSKRPGMSQNNFRDAINAAAVVQVFNSPSQSDDQRLVPFLVSTTQPVLAIEPTWLRLPRFGIPPRLFNDQLYLAISQRLYSKSGHRCRTVSDEANILFKQADSLAALYYDLLSDLARSKGETPDSVFQDQILVAKWAQLNQRREHFNTHWKSLLAPNPRASDIARVNFLNRLISAGVERALRSSNPKLLRDALDKILRKLTREPTPDYDMVSFRAGMQFELSSSAATEQQAKLLYHISRVPPGHQLLTTIERGLPFDKHAHESWLAGSQLAAAVHPASVAAYAVLLVEVGPRKDAGEWPVLIRWVHRLDIMNIWNACVGAFVRASSANTNNELATFQFFGLNSPSNTCELASLSGKLEPELGSADELTSFELSWLGFTITTDVRARDDYERQVVLRCDYVDFREAEQWLTQLMSETMEDRPGSSLCRYLVREVFELFGAGAKNEKPSKE